MNDGEEVKREEYYPYLSSSGTLLFMQSSSSNLEASSALKTKVMAS